MAYEIALHQMSSESYGSRKSTLYSKIISYNDAIKMVKCNQIDRLNSWTRTINGINYQIRFNYCGDEKIPADYQDEFK